MQHETVRKLIHLSTGTLVLLYVRLQKGAMLWIFGSLVVIAVIVEIARRNIPFFRSWFYHTAGALLKPHEKNRVTGATFLLIAAFLSILFFDRWIAFSALLFVVVSDALGGLAGRKWGRHTLHRDRSVEGSAVFLVSALIIVFITPYLPFYIGLSGVLTAFIVELFFNWIDDNITIPIFSGLTMQCLTWAVS